MWTMCAVLAGVVLLLVWRLCLAARDEDRLTGQLLDAERRLDEAVQANWRLSLGCKGWQQRAEKLERQLEEEGEGWKRGAGASWDDDQLI